MAKKKIGKYKHRMPVTSKYRPVNKSKYKGDYTNIIFRSSWEKIVFKYCDLNPAVMQWSSEEFFVPYKSPFDGKYHRYFPDFVVKTVKNEKYMVEIKPSRQCNKPKTPKRKTKSF